MHLPTFRLATPAPAALAAAAPTTEATASAAAAAATEAASPAAGKRSPFFTRARFVDFDGAAIEISAVQFAHGGLHSFSAFHGDKCEPLGPSGFPVHYHEYLGDLAVSGELLAKLLFIDLVGNIFPRNIFVFIT